MLESADPSVCRPVILSLGCEAKLHASGGWGGIEKVGERNALCMWSFSRFIKNFFGTLHFNSIHPVPFCQRANLSEIFYMNLTRKHAILFYGEKKSKICRYLEKSIEIRFFMVFGTNI